MIMKKTTTAIITALGLMLLPLHVALGQENLLEAPFAYDCSPLPISSLIGVNFWDPVLMTKESGKTFKTPTNYVTESIGTIHDYGFNVIRVPYYWEAYVYDPKAFLAETEFIARTAMENKICVIFDFHQYRTGSFWKLQPPGAGFPSFILQNYPTLEDYVFTAEPFWNDFLNNAIVVDQKKVWNLQAKFMSTIIERVDNYKNVLGYEILNEPNLFHASQYKKLGAYHTFMANKLRNYTDKMIFFDREITPGFERKPNLEPLIAPSGVQNIVYAPHLYLPPHPDTLGAVQVKNFKNWSEGWGNIPVLIGEFAASSQTDTDIFVSTFKESGFGWTYWTWKPMPSPPSKLGKQLYASPDMEPTIYLVYVLNAIEEFVRLINAMDDDSI